MSPSIRPRQILPLALTLILLLTAGAAAAAELRLFAAASLRDAVRELTAAYLTQRPDLQLVGNFASSGVLAKQIAAGAPADLYISANPKWMEYLQEQGLIAAGSRRVLVHNSLVFVSLRPDAAGSLAALPDLTRIALGSPASVPAGQYALQALSASGLYAGLQAAGKLVLAKDVRQALLYADRGEVDGAFVYGTDLPLARQARLAFTVPGDLYPRISYPAALTRAAAGNPAAQDFFRFLFSPAAQEVLRRDGFLLPE